MRRVSRGIALTVLSAILLFNAVCADSVVAYGASYDMAAGSATDFVKQIEEDRADTEESTEDASAFGVSAEENASAQEGASTDEASGESSFDEEATEEDSATDASSGESSFDEAAAEGSSNEDAADEASSEDSVIEEVTTDKKLLGAAENQVGENVFYSFSNGVLTLYGSGPTYDFATIQDNPMRNISGIKSLVVSEGITVLGTYSLSYVGDIGIEIESVSLPSTLTEIKENAMYDIRISRSTLTIPTGVTKMGKGALGGYIGNVVFPEGTSEIPAYAFWNGVISGTLSLPDTLEKINEYAFSGVNFHKEVVIPSGVRYIGTGAFERTHGGPCTYTFRGDVPEFGDDVFSKGDQEKNNNLSQFFLTGYYTAGNQTWINAVPSLKERFPDIDFRVRNRPTSGKCGNSINWSISGTTLTLTGSGPMYNYAANNRAPWSDYVNELKMISIGEGITEIGDFAFYRLWYNGNTISVSMPSTLTRIGAYAFEMTYIGTLNIPGNVTYIGDYAFYRTHAKNTGIRLNSNMTYIGNCAFAEANDVGIILPEFTKITKIGNSAFSQCFNVSGSLKFPDTLTYIGEMAFYNCKGLSSELRIPKNLSYLGYNAFNYVGSISGNIEIPDTLTTIPNSAFTNTKITSVKMGDGVTSIGSSAFSGCTALKSANISKNVTELGYSVFKGCTALTELEIPESIKSIRGDAFYGSGIKKLTFYCDMPFANNVSNMNLPTGVVVYYPNYMAGWFKLTDEEKAKRLGLTNSNPTFIGFGDAPVFTVRFYRSDDKVLLDEQKVAAGGLAVMSTNLEREGYYVSSMYYKNKNGHSVSYDISKKIYEDLDVYVVYYNQIVTLTLDFQGRQENITYRFAYGTKLEHFSDVDRNYYLDGYRTYGWSFTPAADGIQGKKIDLSTFELKEDVTFYARWIKSPTEIIMYPDYDKFPKEMKSTFYLEWDGTIGSNVLRDMSGYREGYDFEGWYYDPDFKEKCSEGDVVCKDTLELYAKWRRHTSKVTFIGNGASNFTDYSCEVFYGEPAQKPAVTPEKEGYQFAGWFYGACEYTFDKPIYQDVTLTAMFTDPTLDQDWGNVGEYVREKMGFAVVDQIPERGWIFLEDREVSYRGKAITCPYLRVFDHKTLLKEGTDYTLRYKNNVMPGEATVTVSFKGSYTGSIEEHFTIKPLDLGYSTEIGTDHLYLPFNNKVQKGKTTVKRSVGGKLVTLKEGRDYYYEYPDEAEGNAYKAVGSYKIYIMGKGAFTGRTELSETITDLKLMSKVKVTGVKDLPYTGQDVIQPNMVVKYGSQVLDPEKDYEVDYYSNYFVGTATIRISARAGSEYSGIKTVTFKVTGIPLSRMTFTGIAASVPYDDDDYIYQDVKIYTSAKAAKEKDESCLLKKGTDYRLDYRYNYSVGTAVMNFEGLGKYTGKVTKTFKIVPMKLKDGDVAVVTRPSGKTTDEVLKGQTARVVVILDSSYNYVKKGTKPTPYVYAFDKSGSFYRRLSSKTDYALSYGRNNTPGENAGTMKITFKDDYRGTVQCSFNIGKGDFSKVQISLSDIRHRYAPGICKPVISVKDSDGVKLIQDKDYRYELCYFDDTTLMVYDKGQKTYLQEGRSVKSGDQVDLKNDIVPQNTRILIKIYPMGNYEYKNDKVSLNNYYMVYASDRDISRAKVVVRDKNFNGKEVTLKPEDFVEITLGGQPLKLSQSGDGDCWLRDYKNNTKAGTAKVTLVGCGDYAGTKTITFKIRKTDIGN